jgi:hypothetical protein
MAIISQIAVFEIWAVFFWPFRRDCDINLRRLCSLTGSISVLMWSPNFRLRGWRKYPKNHLCPVLNSLNFSIWEENIRNDGQTSDAEGKLPGTLFSDHWRVKNRGR